MSTVPTFEFSGRTFQGNLTELSIAWAEKGSAKYTFVKWLEMLCIEVVPQINEIAPICPKRAKYEAWRTKLENQWVDCGGAIPSFEDWCK